jgi:glutaminyl-tRNA synthetase
MAVLRPLRVVIDNYPENLVEEMEAVNNPEDAGMGTRRVPFSRVLYIEREDFCEEPPKEFFRLAPGREVRLRYAYFITCVGVVKDERTGDVIELHCTYDPETRGGSAPDGRKVKGTLHWVSASHALEAEVWLYDHLFLKANPNDVEEGRDFKSYINPNSLEILTSCRVEPSLRGAAPGSRYQFERLGYFCVDSVDSSDGGRVPPVPPRSPQSPFTGTAPASGGRGRGQPPPAGAGDGDSPRLAGAGGRSPLLVFNRTVSLRDSWAKISGKKLFTAETAEKRI